MRNAGGGDAGGGMVELAQERIKMVGIRTHPAIFPGLRQTPGVAPPSRATATTRFRHPCCWERTDQPPVFALMNSEHAG